ncbi:MAG: replication-associated recombination protein A [Flavobacteriaceae bacterium]|nr:replication-associated recombination protein A [Flavobacteriaceae bacterium]
MNHIPLAERMRPKTIDDLIGQEHLIGAKGSLRAHILKGLIPSMIFWGPPGVGKTTLASVISEHAHRPFYHLSAINSSVKDVRDVIDHAKKDKGIFTAKNPILFIDEIHRFNKAQQDSLLAAVEKGWITLIGATTENPSFEVISALLSRCQVYVLKAFEEADLVKLLKRAIEKDAVLSEQNISLKETDVLIQLSGGDGRKLLNLLELVVQADTADSIDITNEKVMHFAQKNVVLYDKTGEQHYDIISAFIKSIRGSDPNAAVYYLARMIEGGEDVKFIARRMLILASEDIGNANPTALVMANNTFQAVAVVGHPESRIILSQCAIYLATSPKSNSSYTAINQAQELVRKTGNLSVPLPLRNAPTKLMKDLDYGKSYKYAHDFEGNFAAQNFLPDEIEGAKLYEPGQNQRESSIREFLKKLWGKKYGY